MPIKNPEEHVGKTYEFRILKINLDRKNIVVSRRDLIEESRRESRRKVLSEIQVGQLRPGVVKNITDFGAFVDLDGIDGLLHVTDMTWGRINHPSEQLKIGDKLNVMVLEIDLQKKELAWGLNKRWKILGKTSKRDIRQARKFMVKLLILLRMVLLLN